MYRDGLILPAEPDFFVSLQCGIGLHRFTGNLHTVPNFKGHPLCKRHLEELNVMRARMNMATWNCPENAYPEGA